MSAIGQSSGFLARAGSQIEQMEAALHSAYHGVEHHLLAFVESAPSPDELGELSKSSDVLERDIEAARALRNKIGLLSLKIGACQRDVEEALEREPEARGKCKEIVLRRLADYPAYQSQILNAIARKVELHRQDAHFDQVRAINQGYLETLNAFEDAVASLSGRCEQLRGLVCDSEKMLEAAQEYQREAHEAAKVIIEDAEYAFNLPKKLAASISSKFEQAAKMAAVTGAAYLVFRTAPVALPYLKPLIETAEAGQKAIASVPMEDSIDPSFLSRVVDAAFVFRSITQVVVIVGTNGCF